MSDAGFQQQVNAFINAEADRIMGLIHDPQYAAFVDALKTLRLAWGSERSAVWGGGVVDPPLATMDTIATSIAPDSVLWRGLSSDHSGGTLFATLMEVQRRLEDE